MRGGAAREGRDRVVTVGFETRGELGEEMDGRLAERPEILDLRDALL